MPRGRFDPILVTGLAVLAVATVLAILAPWISPTDPLVQHDVLQTRFLPPLTRGPDGVMHWLGTDSFGRDMLARLLYGARISLAVGFLAVGLSLGIGVGVGAAAAVVGGATERTLMGLTDAALALPRLVLLLALVALFEPGLWLVIIVLGVTGWMPVARLARAEIRAVLARPYVMAARATGVGRAHLLLRHVLPNAAAPLLVAAALAVGNAITLESGLAFLGLGVPPPAPSWGNMIAGGREALVNAPWVSIIPGLAIIAVVVATNLVSDGIRDVIDPATARATPGSSRSPAVQHRTE